MIISLFSLPFSIKLLERIGKTQIFVSRFFNLGSSIKFRVKTSPNPRIDIIITILKRETSFSINPSLPCCAFWTPLYSRRLSFQPLTPSININKQAVKFTLIVAPWRFTWDNATFLLLYGPFLCILRAENTPAFTYDVG